MRIKSKIIITIIAIIVVLLFASALAFYHLSGFKTKGDYRQQKVYYTRNSFRYAAYIFAPLAKGPYPGIIFCHGNLPSGKDTALYLEMCRQLARRGYVIINFDIKGFGESEKITKVRLPDDLDFVADALAATDYFSGLGIVNKDNLSIVGHSSGGNIALAAGVQDPRIKNIICVSPGDFNPSKNPRELKVHYRNRLAKGLEYVMPMDYYHKLVTPLAMLQYCDQLAGKNILIIIAELDHINQKRFAQELYNQIQDAESRELIEIKDAIHTIGARLVDGNKIEDVSKITALTDTIANWIKAVKK